MADPWEVLKEAGVPDGAPRPRPAGPLDEDQVRRALESLIGQLEDLEPRRLEPLLAWLQAGFHHWPTGFAELLGPGGAEIRDRLIATAGDAIEPGRYLKLRRIAIENLAAYL